MQTRFLIVIWHVNCILPIHLSVMCYTWSTGLLFVSSRGEMLWQRGRLFLVIAPHERHDLVFRNWPSLTLSLNFFSLTFHTLSKSLNTAWSWSTVKHVLIAWPFKNCEKLLLAHLLVAVTEDAPSWWVAMPSCILNFSQFKLYCYFLIMFPFTVPDLNRTQVRKPEAKGWEWGTYTSHQQTVQMKTSEASIVDHPTLMWHLNLPSSNFSPLWWTILAALQLYPFSGTWRSYEKC